MRYEFNLFFPVIIVNNFKLVPSVLFWTPNLSDKSKVVSDGSSRVLQLSRHLFKLTINGQRNRS